MTLRSPDTNQQLVSDTPQVDKLDSRNWLWPCPIVSIYPHPSNTVYTHRPHAVHELLVLCDSTDRRLLGEGRHFVPTRDDQIENNRCKAPDQQAGAEDDL